MPVIQFLVQWRHISSESAVSHVWVLFLTFEQCFHLFITILATQMLCHELHGMFYMWWQMWQELQENCVINVPNGKSSKTAVLVILPMRSLVLHRTAEPQEALWQGHSYSICCNQIRYGNAKTSCSPSVTQQTICWKFHHLICFKIRICRPPRV